jgi:hypothetical protein
VDGISVQLVRGKTFPIAIAQRLDIELAIPTIAAAYPVLAALEGEGRRTGIVLLSELDFAEFMPRSKALP